MTLGIKQKDAPLIYSYQFLTDTDFTGNEAELVNLTSAGLVELTSDLADNAIGVIEEVLWWDSDASEGNVMVRLFAPVVKVKCGGTAVACGALLSPHTSDGVVLTATGAGTRVIGIALVGADAGDVFDGTSGSRVDDV